MMQKTSQSLAPRVASRWLPVGVMALTLAILGAAILITSLQVRLRVRDQIAGRDGEVLHAVALMEYASEAAAGLGGLIEDPASRLSVALKTSQLKGVMGVRLFDRTGRFEEPFPPELRDGVIAPADLIRLKSLRPVCHFHPSTRLSELFYGEPGQGGTNRLAVPWLEVNVPLHADPERGLAGIAQFLLEGTSIASEYARLDRHLALQAAGTFAAGGLMLVSTLGWTWWRLRRAHRVLARRTEDLVQANQELALAAKTSALGAVAAHLLHDLKNPLAGLQSYMALREPAPGSSRDPDWQEAAASTRRMQDLINQVVNVIHEEQTGASYEVTLSELMEILTRRVQPVADETAVQFQCAGETEGALPNRIANLAALILVNLVQNALQATPRGGRVRLAVSRCPRDLRFEVRDEGAGFPPGHPPFAPCHSSKTGGSGIGLALSKQLANRLGASLELERSTPQGCVFVLALPAPAGDPESRDAAAAATV